MNKFLEKKYLYPVSGLLLLIIIAVATVFTVHTIREERNEWWKWKFSRFEQRDSKWKENVSKIQRAAVNTASGIEVVITTTDTGSISRVNGEFEILKGSSLIQNSAYSIVGVKTNNSLKISITSNIPDVVKIIQKDAADGTSGIFGIELSRQSNSKNQEKEEGKSGKYEKSHTREGKRESK